MQNHQDQSLRVTSVGEVKTAKDTRQYFVVGFRAGFGQKEVNRTFWQQFVRDPKTGENTTKLKWERATPEEAKELLASRELISASRVTATVVPYTIGDREVNTFTTVMFPDEDVYRLFSSHDHPIVDEHGEIHETRRPKAVIAPPTVADNVAENAEAATV